jgi:hypothetical protein
VGETDSATMAELNAIRISYRLFHWIIFGLDYMGCLETSEMGINGKTEALRYLQVA